MSQPPARSALQGRRAPIGEPQRVAFIGARAWLEGCTPASAVQGLVSRRFEFPQQPGRSIAGELKRFRPHVTVVFDPAAIDGDLLVALPAPVLGVLVGGVPEGDCAWAGQLDRLVSFRPSLTGTEIDPARLWRAIPPPVGDAFFGPVSPLHRAPRAMSIGRSTPHRETILMPAKHHHDLLQLLHGVSGEPLAELLREYDVGVYVAPREGGGFGLPVGLHLAAGQLLLSDPLSPGHGLERDIDYLQFDSPEALVWMLERMGRFPEMHQRVRVRGRLKAEQFRASRLFARLLADLHRDLASFGAGRAVGA
jgi:hypothetical protein